MRINLKNTPEQVELIKAMGSHDVSTAREANEAFAAFLGPVVQRVLNQAATAGSVYTDAPYDEDDSPSYPLDLYYADGDNVVTTFMQSVAGGLPTSHVEGMKELKIATYRLDSAVSLLKRYARRGRLDIVSKAVERMAQEVLVKQERNAWAVILKALAEGSTNSNTHTITSTTQDQFQLDDMNRLMTRIRRLNESFAGGTADVNYSNGLTDMYMSPEMVEQVRGFAYQPMNTRNGSGSGATSLALPDNVRENVFRSAGAQELYGVNINELNELGVNKKYTTLFDTFTSGNIAHGSSAFDGTDDELIIGLDNSKGAFIRPVALQHESGGQFVTLPDDQFSARSEKIGFFGYLEEGRVCIDARAVVGIVV